MKQLSHHMQMAKLTSKNTGQHWLFIHLLCFLPRNYGYGSQVITILETATTFVDLLFSWHLSLWTTFFHWIVNKLMLVDWDPAEVYIHILSIFHYHCFQFHLINCMRLSLHCFCGYWFHFSVTWIIYQQKETSVKDHTKLHSSWICWYSIYKIKHERATEGEKHIEFILQLQYIFAWSQRLLINENRIEKLVKRICLIKWKLSRVKE